MVNYQILPYTRKKAKRLNVLVKPAQHNKTKKIDVFTKQGKYITSVGAKGMNDYPTYWKNQGKLFANKRRRLYKMRHEKDRHKRGSNGWYADQLLW